MPIPPAPSTYHCPACGWSQTVHPRSDALGPADHFSHCPRCGKQPLEHKPASLLASTLNQLGRLLKP